MNLAIGRDFDKWKACQRGSLFLEDDEMFSKNNGRNHTAIAAKAQPQMGTSGFPIPTCSRPRFVVTSAAFVIYDRGISLSHPLLVFPANDSIVNIKHEIAAQIMAGYRNPESQTRFTNPKSKVRTETLNWNEIYSYILHDHLVLAYDLNPFSACDGT